MFYTTQTRRPNPKHELHQKNLTTTYTETATRVLYTTHWICLTLQILYSDSRNQALKVNGSAQLSFIRYANIHKF